MELVVLVLMVLMVLGVMVWRSEAVVPGLLINTIVGVVLLFVTNLQRVAVRLTQGPCGA